MEAVQLIAYHIRYLREASGISQRELAVRLDLDEKNYGKVERGEAKRLDLERLRAISEALGVGLGYVLRPLTDTRKGCDVDLAASDMPDAVVPYQHEQVIGQLLSIMRKQQFIIGELDRLSVNSESNRTGL